MASITPKQLIAAQQLTAAAVTYYTVPANVRAIIQKLTFTNVTAVARTVTVRFVVSGGTGSATNTIAITKTIPAYDYWIGDVGQGHVLETGGFIEALSDSAASVVILASGLEVAI